jgi:hypothetical protein
MKNFFATVTLSGTFDVSAEDEDDAAEKAIQMAMDDPSLLSEECDVEEITDEDDGEGEGEDGEDEK